MGTVPSIVICPQNQADKLSIVFEAMGRGPDSFTQGRALCAIDPNATPNTPATHRFIQDMSATVELEDMWRKMASGEAMPQVNWGETPGITESSAIAAAASMTVISIAGQGSGSLDVDSILAGLGLQFVPSIEI
jgi:hypothetical protein